MQRSQTTGVLLVTMKKSKPDSTMIYQLKKKQEQAIEDKEKFEKVKETNINQIIEKQKKVKELEKMIKEDEDLDDLPELE